MFLAPGKPVPCTAVSQHTQPPTAGCGHGWEMPERAGWLADHPTLPKRLLWHPSRQPHGTAAGKEKSFSLGATEVSSSASTRSRWTPSFHAERAGPRWKDPLYRRGTEGRFKTTSVHNPAPSEHGNTGQRSRKRNRSDALTGCRGPFQVLPSTAVRTFYTHQRTRSTTRSPSPQHTRPEDPCRGLSVSTESTKLNLLG